ncbi:hypothetical protein [Roseococcus sp. YIM B11640]|uniref:hypothetical protein n=1 Tax=Roseococcus sp. YIM B11640 TaxID=3133973 RepID=UPI003C7CCA2B
MEERHDDGLVHDHGWAREAPHPPGPRRQVIRPMEWEHDEGLVHSHGWASVEPPGMPPR